MTNFLRFFTVALAMMGATLVAQNQTPTDPAAAPTSTPTANPASSTKTPRIAAGSVIPVQLMKTVDAKKAKTGDEVVAKVTIDMKNKSGDVLMPKDTKVIGHVTEAQPRDKEQKESQLAIAFNQAVMKDGQVALPMSIQAVIGQQNNNNSGAMGPPPSSYPNSSGGGSSMPGGSSRSPMGGQQDPQASQSPVGAGAPPTGDASPPITAQTQGVIGIPNLNLSPDSNAQQGSTLTSDKNNVKLESGTMLLLKVSQ